MLYKMRKQFDKDMQLMDETMNSITDIFSQKKSQNYARFIEFSIMGFDLKSLSGGISESSQNQTSLLSKREKSEASSNLEYMLYNDNQNLGKLRANLIDEEELKEANTCKNEEFMFDF